MIKSYNLSRRWEDVKDDVLKGMAELHTNEQVVNGTFTKQVEDKLRQVSKRKYALLCRSGSHAITMSLVANNIGFGHRVIVPNYSCPATLSSVAVIGCVPVFCEIDQYGMMDPNELQALAESGAKAVLATGLYGDTHNHDTVKNFCEQNEMVYINDAAQSQFALYKGINSLELGDIVCMSFADNKSIPVAGTFGAVLTDDKILYEKVRVLRKNGKPTRLEDFETAGFSSHPDEDKAVQILASFKHYEKWQNRKVEIGKIYDEAFKGKVYVRPSPSYSTWNGHKYAIMVKDKFQSYKKLLEAGIETEQHYVDNFGKLLWTPNYDREYPMSDKFVDQSLTIPNNPHMTDAEVQQVIDAVVNNCVAPSS
tara:strand:- start:4753 stop:5850 length:1098 start_codon:yes stop_codon:yes gene_type:complete